MGVTIKMALLLGQGSAASFHYGFSKHIHTWLGGLFFQNGHSLFTCVLKKYKTTTSNSIDFIPQLYCKVLKPGHLQTADGEEVKQKVSLFFVHCHSSAVVEIKLTQNFNLFCFLFHLLVNSFHEDESKFFFIKEKRMYWN